MLDTQSAERSQELPYYNMSNKLMWASTSIYIVAIVLTASNYVTILFSICYIIESVYKFTKESKIYTSEYYSWGFMTLDFLAGPAALLISVIDLIRDKSCFSSACLFIIFKVMTCRFHMYRVKEIYYIVRATWYYQRLSLSIFVMFVCLSYMTFSLTSAHFSSMPQSVISMLQVSAFDGWNEDGVYDVKMFLSRVWLLYFIFYFFVVIITFATTMLGFFTAYYSHKQLQVDFDFDHNRFVYVSSMAEILGLEKYPRRKGGQKQSEIYITVIAIYCFIESVSYKYLIYRKYFVVAMILASAMTTSRRVLWAINNTHYRRKVSTVIMVTRFALMLAAYICCLFTNSNLVLVVWACMSVCLIDVIRHNGLLLDLIRNNFKVIRDYIIILFAICYVFAVFIVRHPILVNQQPFDKKIKSFVDSVTFNLQIMGMENWSIAARKVIDVNPKWLLYFLSLIFIAGFIIVNVFMAQIVKSSEKKIVQQLLIHKKERTRLYYDDLTDLTRRCYVEARHQVIDATY